MEFCILSLVVLVVVLIICACSITNFVNQLPDCSYDTKKAIDRTVVMMGSFINFGKNTKMLSNRIDVLTALIQESQSEEDRLASIKEEAVQVKVEAEGLINSGWWYRRWTSFCYELSNRVAVQISKINCVVEPSRFQECIPSTGDEVPGIVVVFLVIYALTNAVLHLPNSTTARRDAIDWIVTKMVYAFKLKKNLKMLRDRMEVVKEEINKIRAGGHRTVEEWEDMKEWLERIVLLVVEGELLCDEAEDMKWYKGWMGSRYRLGKRVEEIFNRLQNLPRLIGGGMRSRRLISKVDDIRCIFPLAITDIRHYLRFNDNIDILNLLIRDSDSDSDSEPPQLNAAEAQKFADLVTSLEVARNEGMQLIKQAESTHQPSWYKSWSSSRYELSKRVVKIIMRIYELEDALRELEHRGSY